MMQTRWLAPLFTVVAACGGGGSTSPHADAHQADAPPTHDAPHTADAAKTPDAAMGSQLVLHVPASYSGSPRQLAIVGAKHVPLAGPPDAVFLLDNTPMPQAGQAMSLTLHTSTANGAMYLVVVLYQQGGGQYSPKAGVDYDAQSTSTFNFTGAPMDLGTLDLALAQ